MKVVLVVRNFLTHHYLPLCLELYKKLGDDFKFVSNKKIYDWRLELGFEDLDKKYDFVIRSYESNEEKIKANKLILESDIVIVGETTNDAIEERLKEDKLTLRYSYRPFLIRDGYLNTLKKIYNLHIKYRKNKNLYLLAINGFANEEFKILKLYNNKIYKWGYFISPNNEKLDKLLEIKNKNKIIKIIWVARFIKWKHPEIVIKLAKNLKNKNIKFKIEMLGTGKLIDKIKEEVINNKLDDVINIVGKVPSDKVNNYMKKANIFIGTSSKEEGWELL